MILPVGLSGRCSRTSRPASTFIGCSFISFPPRCPDAPAVMSLIEPEHVVLLFPALNLLIVGVANSVMVQSGAPSCSWCDGRRSLSTNLQSLCFNADKDDVSKCGWRRCWWSKLKRHLSFTCSCLYLYWLVLIKQIHGFHLQLMTRTRRRTAPLLRA